MDRQQLATRIVDALPIEQHDLTRKKVECRAIIIRESNLDILFDVERHPGAGTSQSGGPYTTLQTWRYDKRANQLERVCEFARWYMNTLEQNDDGKPACRKCGSVFDLGENVFGFVWRCPDCDAIGGKEEEIFSPSIGEPLGQRKDYEEKENGLWVPITVNES